MQTSRLIKDCKYVRRASHVVDVRANSVTATSKMEHAGMATRSPQVETDYSAAGYYLRQAEAALGIAHDG